MQTVKVIAKVVHDNSGVFTEVPVLLDENKHVIKPLLDYTLKLKRDGRSHSSLTKLIKAAQLLLEYMVSNMECFATPQSMFESFSTRLYTGTINDEGIDPSGLFWLPHSPSVARSHIYLLTQLTDWLADQQNAQPLNPLIKADNFTQRLNYAAWFRKNHNDFLGHIKDKHINSTVRKARSVQGKTPLGKNILDAVEFPEIYFHDFFLKGLGKSTDIRASLRDQLILLLMHGGGLRESEALHLWIEDVLIDPENINSVRVRIYHPENGKAPYNWRSRSGKTTRAAYLKEKYSLSPRNQLIGKKYLGWKSRVIDDKDHYLDVHWFPAIFGEVFAKYWHHYMRLISGIDRNHPYAFISFHYKYFGYPYTLNSFNANYGNGLKRIGLRPCKADGLSPHSHRHSYGRRLFRAGVNEIIIMKCLHHSSIESQVTYTTPTAREITSTLNKALTTMSQPTIEGTEKRFPDWDSLLLHGFEDVDPKGLFSGKYPKLGNRNVA